MIVTLLLGVSFSLHLQVYIMNLVNFLFLVYILTHRPFNETRENSVLIIHEGAFAAATLLLPFFIVDVYTDTVGNLMLNILRGSGGKA